ncbi:MULTISPECIES: HD domain-containing protein [unclassified Endozoicomonas]|uniref:HD domain-containing protein n=1 Tax=unclassified Endozoicomonas TaxID=2644528 RepID=UPI003BAE93C1
MITCHTLSESGHQQFRRFSWYLLLAHLCVLGFLTKANSNDHEQIETYYGLLEFNRAQFPLLSELLNSQPVKRLKNINQYGIIQLVDSQGHNNESYTRYDHSLGVLYLLNYFGAPFEEQVSGLLHDISHTTFSHVSDYLFTTSSAGNPDYHDSLFRGFLEKHGVALILKNHGLTPDDVAPENIQFTMLERELPDICADRLDYILQGSVRRKTLTREQVDQIIKSLRHDPLTNHWYFSSQDSAQLLADASLELNKNIFVTAWGRTLYQWTTEAIRRMISINELTLEDIKYQMGDREVWQSMLSSEDTKVAALVEKIKSAWYRVYETTDANEASTTFENLRCRVVDPRVMVSASWKRLSALSPSFKRKYQAEMERCRFFYAAIKSP